MGLCDTSGSCHPYPGMMTVCVSLFATVSICLSVHRKYTLSLSQRVPKGIDIISADIYEINEGWESNAVRKVYEEKLYPALSAHQVCVSVSLSLSLSLPLPFSLSASLGAF